MSRPNEKRNADLATVREVADALDDFHRPPSFWKLCHAAAMLRNMANLLEAHRAAADGLPIPVGMVLVSRTDLERIVECTELEMLDGDMARKWAADVLSAFPKEHP